MSLPGGRVQIVEFAEQPVDLVDLASDSGEGGIDGRPQRLAAGLGVAVPEGRSADDGVPVRRVGAVEPSLRLRDSGAQRLQFV